MKKIFHPTCRICEKLNEMSTHCAIYGGLDADMVDNPAIAAACMKSGYYIRLLRAVPNEHNYIDADTIGDLNDLRIFCSTDTDPFLVKQGMTLEEWASATFGEKRGDSYGSD